MPLSIDAIAPALERQATIDRALALAARLDPTTGDLDISTHERYRPQPAWTRRDATDAELEAASKAWWLG